MENIANDIRVLDELEIRNLVARLAHLADVEKDMSEYITSFTEDALWQMGTTEYRGRDSILAGAFGRRASGLQGPGTRTRHVITTQWVRVDGDLAVGDVYLLFMAETSSAPYAKGLAHYADQYRRTPEGWKLAERIITAG